MNVIRLRQPAGTPAGGQFAERAGSAPVTQLHPADPTDIVLVSYRQTAADVAAWRLRVEEAEAAYAAHLEAHPVALPHPGQNATAEEVAEWDRATGGWQNRCTVQGVENYDKGVELRRRAESFNALKNVAPAAGKLVPVSQVVKSGAARCADGGWNVWLTTGERVTHFQKVYVEGFPGPVGLVGEDGSVTARIERWANHRPQVLDPMVYLVETSANSSVPLREALRTS